MYVFVYFIDLSYAGEIGNMSTFSVSGKPEFSPHREIAHIRQDLVVTKEILAIVRDENERLCRSAEERAAEVARLSKDLEDARRLLQDQRLSFETEIARLQSSRSSLEEELAEALTERKRLLDLLHKVKGQVDGRLTTLVEELQRKDETIHCLEYRNKEFERNIERLSRMVKLDSDKSSELEDLQEKYSKALADVLFLQEKIAQYQVEATTTPQTNQPLIDCDVNSSRAFSLDDVIPLLFLYRQWLQDVVQSLRDIEDGVEMSLNDGIDSLSLLTCSGVAYKPPTIERKRLEEMKNFERGCTSTYVGMTPSQEKIEPCDEKGFAFSVHAIRCAWDCLRHLLEKVKVLTKQLSDTMQSVARVSVDLHAKTMPGNESMTVMTNTKGDSGTEVESRAWESAKENLELQLQFCAEEKRKMDAEINNLKFMLSTIEAEKASLKEEISKIKEDAVNASLNSAAKLTTLECKLQTVLKSAEESSTNAFRAAQIEHEKKIEEITNTNTRLTNALETERSKIESMKKALVESKRRRLALKEENAAFRKQLQNMEEHLGSLRVELLGAKRTIELLNAELNFAGNRQDDLQFSPKTFFAFKKGIQKTPVDSKTLFISKQL